jgi:RecA-family ATPase
MLYDICISAALGRELFGGRKPKRGCSLYLALEDNPRRLRSRGEKLLGFHMGPCPGVSLATTWDRVDQDGLQLIRDWVGTTRAKGDTVALIAIDVLKMVRPPGRDRQSAYDKDYESLQGLRSLASELGIAIIVAHHQRKAGADDLGDTVSGTQGLTGAADCCIVLERQASGGFVLDVRGRDVEAQQLAASFDRETCRWNVGGDASEARRSEAWRAIREALKEGAPEGMTPQEISADTGIKSGTVRSALLRMARDGEITKVKGKYVLGAHT